jgi:hypothetical protein
MILLARGVAILDVHTRLAHLETNAPFLAAESRIPSLRVDMSFPTLFGNQAERTERERKVEKLITAMSSDPTDAEVFVYTGAGGERVPDDVVRLRVDPSVTTIPADAFYQQKQLTEVELCEGLVEIGERSFADCGRSITKINISTSLRRICNAAFHYSLRTNIRLHDGIESIGEGAFAACIFTNFRVPPLITTIPQELIVGCRAMFSLEVPDIVTEIEKYAFSNCSCLRNVAIPPNVVIGYDIFIYYEEDDEDIHTDLLQLFGSNARIISELSHRFDGLPIHKLVYYQSYTEGVLQILLATINSRSGQSRKLRSRLNPTGNQQDCLGMTPLHILACSSVLNLELYRLIVDNYPTNLVTEDSWGALPLLYAFWGAVPAEIIQFLLESYQSLYPTHVFNWTMMVETMGRCDTPKESIENLLRVRQMYFPEQPLDWEYLLDKFFLPSQFSFGGLPNQERLQYLVMCGMSTQVEALAFKVWRDYITSMIQTADFNGCYNLANLREIQSILAHLEGELSQLKEVTTILELALWKMKMNEKSHQDIATQSQKRIKTDEASTRQQCRVKCGADVVIGYVLPFLKWNGIDPTICIL